MPLSAPNSTEKRSEFGALWRSDGAKRRSGDLAAVVGSRPDKIARSPPHFTINFILFLISATVSAACPIKKKLYRQFQVYKVVMFWKKKLCRIFSLKSGRDCQQRLGDCRSAAPHYKSL